mgnify:CR=1 FL=1
MALYMNGVSDFPAVVRTASVLGWEPEDIARNLFLNELMEEIEQLDWGALEQEVAIRMIAQGVLAIDDPSGWQRVLNRLDMSPEILWLENASCPESSALRQQLERFPQWGKTKVSDEHETSRWFQGCWNRDLPFSLTIHGPDRPRRFASGESVKFVGMDLDGWTPELIRVHSHLGFKDCHGLLRASAVSAETLELNPDLDVEISTATLHSIRRRLRDNLTVEYAPASTRLCWQAGTLDLEGVDPEGYLFVYVEGKTAPPPTLPPGTFVTFQKKGAAFGRRLGFPGPIPLWNLFLDDLPRLRRLPRGFRFQGLRDDRVDLADPSGEKPSRTGGSLSITRCPWFGGLPEQLQIPSNLRLRELPRLRGLPSGLEVGGELTVAVARGLRFVKAGLRVGSTAMFKRLPRWYRWDGPALIGGDLHLVDCPSLQALPDPLIVGGNMVVDGLRSLHALPPSLRVMGSLSVKGSGVRTLPDGAWVGGVLSCT